MEKKEKKIVLFGDSITRAVGPYFEKELAQKYPERKYEVINAGINSQTTKDALLRIESILMLCPDVVVVAFGMNDWRDKKGNFYGVSENEYKENLIKIVDILKKNDIRVLLSTITPSYNFEKKFYNTKTKSYSNVLRRVAREKKIKVVDLEIMWENEIPDLKSGLSNELHPNDKGYRLISKYLTLLVPRRHSVVLWQYNGREAKCNYRCPYCYYAGLHNPNDRFTGYIKQWHERFKEAFGDENLIFYLAFGEPTLGAEFPNILKMIESEKKWKLRITSNASVKLDLLTKSKLASQKRLFINASFHPCHIKIEKFIKNIELLRSSGIEVCVVYVAYPPYLKHFQEDIELFKKHRFVVHVRRFVGKYQDKIYPNAYSDDEKCFIAKFMDDISIKYMLNQQRNIGDMVFSGYDFFIVDNAGNVGYDSDAFAPYTKNRAILGNIHTGNFRPMLYPTKYPGTYQGTTDGVSNLLDLGIKQLEGNNTLDFARQGGVYEDENGDIIYSNFNKDFKDEKVRQEYNFPPLKKHFYKFYEKEHELYSKYTKNLFYFQKHKIDPWLKGENFGDYLSKVIVGSLAKKYNLKEQKDLKHNLLAIGSILHFAKNHDTIWGSGINGKIPYENLDFNTLDIRALRGPLSAEVLQKQKGIKSPQVYGDPALLLPYLFDDLKPKAIKNKITLIANLNEYEECKNKAPVSYNIVSPLLHWSKVVEEILSSEIVLTSSLHGLIVSESLGVEVRLYKPFGGETMFKYEDYLEGTNRKLKQMPKSFMDGFSIKNGVEFDELDFNKKDLLEAFPKDLFV